MRCTDFRHDDDGEQAAAAAANRVAFIPLFPVRTDAAAFLVGLSVIKTSRSAQWVSLVIPESVLSAAWPPGSAPRRRVARLGRPLPARLSPRRSRSGWPRATTGRAAHRRLHVEGNVSAEVLRSIPIGRIEAAADVQVHASRARADGPRRDDATHRGATCAPMPCAATRTPSTSRWPSAYRPLATSSPAPDGRAGRAPTTCRSPPLSGGSRRPAAGACWPPAARARRAEPGQTTVMPDRSSSDSG